MADSPRRINTRPPTTLRRVEPLYRAVIVRMRWHEPTIAYVKRRTAEGLTKKEIIRCLKRYLAREVYALLPTPAPPAALADAA